MLRSSRLVVALALAALVAAVAAGCGSSSTSGESASPAASAAAVDKTKAFKVGISQIVTHPALDATVQGIQDELTAQGFTDISTTCRTPRATCRPPPASRRSSPATASTWPSASHADLAGAGQGDHRQARAVHRGHRPGRRRARQGPDRAERQRDRRQRHAAGQADPRAGQDLPSRRQGRGHGLQRRRVQLGVPGDAGGEGSRRHGAHHRQGAGEHLGRGPGGRPVAHRPRQAIMVIGDNTAVSALESIIKVAEQNQMPLVAGDPTASSVAPSPPTASTTTTSASRPAPWPPGS